MSGPIDGGGYTGGEGVQQGTGDGGTTTSGVNPSWNEYLQEVPQEYHDKVIPAFQKWDAGVQQRFQQVHQEYEPYKSYKPIIDAGVDADTATFALKLLNSINEDPRTVWEALGNYYKLAGSPDGQGLENEPNRAEEDPYAGRLAEIERQNQIMAATLVSSREKELAAQADAQLDTELAEVRKKYGDFDENYVLAYMSNGYGAEDAVKQYVQFRDAERAKFGAKPLIMGSGGGVPQFGNADVTKMSSGDTKSLVVQMLAAAKAERER
jgi:hypothetical protein